MFNSPIQWLRRQFSSQPVTVTTPTLNRLNLVRVRGAQPLTSGPDMEPLNRGMRRAQGHRSPKQRHLMVVPRERV